MAAAIGTNLGEPVRSSVRPRRQNAVLTTAGPVDSDAGVTRPIPSAKVLWPLGEMTVGERSLAPLAGPHYQNVMTNTPTRNALVTGGNKGLGLEIARRLGEAGLRVWLGAREAQAGEAAAATLREGGADVRSVHLNLVDPATIAAAAAEIVRTGN